MQRTVNHVSVSVPEIINHSGITLDILFLLAEADSVSQSTPISWFLTAIGTLCAVVTFLFRRSERIADERYAEQKERYEELKQRNDECEEDRKKLWSRLGKKGVVDGEN